MFKRLFCLLMALTMLPVFALAEESSASALTWQELKTWTDGYKARAMASQPMNDPTDPDANTDDGYVFMYDFATLYMDRPEMTEDAVMKEMVIYAYEEEAPHGTRVDYTSEEILSTYYHENPDLRGDYDFAPLYVSDHLPMGAAWGWVQRDGQRIMTIQYGVHEQTATGGDGYTDAGLVYTIQDDSVAAIRAYGLDQVVAEEDVRQNLQAVQDLFQVNTYARQPISYAGVDLPPFGMDDLMFAGMDFSTVTPEKAKEVFGPCHQETWTEDDNGEYIYTMEFEHCEITFVCDKNKQNARAEVMAITTDGMEGPRAIRLGDTFASVRLRFRHSEGETDGMSEVLYGDMEGSDYGMAEYGEDASATLRYQVKTPVGDVMLYLYFEQRYLSEILLFNIS